MASNAGSLKCQFDFSGQVAVITGGSLGIGFSIARAMFQSGARVAILARNPEPLERARATIAAEAATARPGARIEAYPCDVCNADAILSTHARIVSELGDVDILVNNAGVTRDNLFIRMKDEEWDQVLRVNLDSAFYLTRAAVKNMMRRRFGRVIFITYVVGSMGNPGQANYAASKAAISAMAKSVGQEVASRNITLNCIAPGFIPPANRFPMTRSASPRKRFTNSSNFEKSMKSLSKLFSSMPTPVSMMSILNLMNLSSLYFLFSPISLRQLMSNSEQLLSGMSFI